MKALRAGFFQFAPVFGRISQNLNHVTSRLVKANADLWVLPELFNTGYQFVSRAEVADLAESVPNGFTTRRLVEFAKDTKTWLVAGLPERAGRSFYNSSVLVGPRGHAGTYRKTHLFYEEKLWFQPGRDDYRVYDIGKARIGMMVCFDWIFPEVARSLALAGADLLCHPANLVLPYGPDAMITRCLENRVFAVTANRIGSERRGGKKRLTYIGQSEIVDPAGRILVRAGSRSEALRVVDLDPGEARNKRLNRFNHLILDRRPELYLRNHGKG